jgi:exosortase A-associated hydrolase 2
MTAAGDVSADPLFLESRSGSIFAVHYAPRRASPPSCAVLYLPPFAEEMNRSRRMASLQARALAACGIAVLLVDPYGTGDSVGEFREARWSLWLDDVTAAADWLERRTTAPTCLWGLRLGALLAVASASKHPERFKRLLLWQPVLDGAAMLNQFLRVRVASSMAGRVETMAELRAQLAKGDAVEVSGYKVSGELAREMEAVRMRSLPLDRAVKVDWLEIASEAGERLAPASQSLIDSWRAGGVAVASTTVAGDPFWSLQETTVVPDLLEATTSVLTPWPK